MKFLQAYMGTPLADTTPMGKDLLSETLNSQASHATDTIISSQFGEEQPVMDFLGIPLFDGPGLIHLLALFAFNLLVCWIIVHFFYYKKSRRKDYYFTYMLFSVTIFALLFMLKNLSIEIGFGLGLFAIFGLLRYRTDAVPIREMTYLFVIIGISIINGFGMAASSYVALFATNVLVVLMTWVMESGIGRNNKSTQATKMIMYEKIELIKPDRYDDMLDDLRQRTGLDIVKAEVGYINFLKDTAYVKVFYRPENGQGNSIDMVTKYKGTV